MDTNLHELYQSILLEHNKRPKNYGAPEVYTHVENGFNPLCGDKVTIFLNLKEDYIETVCFEAASCAICKASASMMTEAVRGKSTQMANQVSSHIYGLFSKGSDAVIDLEKEGELAALVGVRKFPARVKCALLPWQTLIKVI